MMHKKSVGATIFGAYLIYAIIMVCAGIIAIITNKYDSICAILFGITFLRFTYSTKKGYSPSFTINYINHLKGYFVGASSILYGLVRLFCE